MKVKDKENLNNPLKGWKILSAISSMIFHTVQCITNAFLIEAPGDTWVVCCLFESGANV